MSTKPLQKERIIGGKKRGPKPKDVTKKLLAKFERRLKS